MIIVEIGDDTRGRSKEESTTAMYDMYANFTEDNINASELLTILTRNVATFMTGAQYHDFVEHCLNER